MDSGSRHSDCFSIKNPTCLLVRSSNSEWGNKNIRSILGPFPRQSCASPWNQRFSPPISILTPNVVNTIAISRVCPGGWFWVHCELHVFLRVETKVMESKKLLPWSPHSWRWWPACGPWEAFGRQGGSTGVESFRCNTLRGMEKLELSFIDKPSPSLMCLCPCLCTLVSVCKHRCYIACCGCRSNLFLILHLVFRHLPLSLFPIHLHFQFPGAL